MDGASRKLRGVGHRVEEDFKLNITYSEVNLLVELRKNPPDAFFAESFWGCRRVRNLPGTLIAKVPKSAGRQGLIRGLATTERDAERLDAVCAEAVAELMNAFPKRS